MDLAPIIMFVYNRPWHTRQTLESLVKNKLAPHSIINIYLDAPNPKATEEDLIKIAEVKDLIYEKKWCGTVNIIENRENLGIDYQTPLRINEILEKFDSIIVIEDDCVLSPGFLKYMNDALNTYKSDEKVMHVAGWIPPIKRAIPNLSFVQGITYNWGWATWKRAWENYNTDVEFLLAELKRGNVAKFDLNNSVGSYNYLKEVSVKPVKQQNWDIIWHASVYLSGGLTLLPGKTLVNNIGLDGSGLHCTEEIQKIYGYKGTAKSINVKKIRVEENQKTRKVLEHFYTTMYAPKFSDKLKDKLKYEWKKLLGYFSKH